MNYERELEWNEPPSLSERRYARWAVVRAAGAPAASWWPLARLGAVDLYLAPPGSEHDAPARSVTPLIARKRGRRGSGDYAGVDGDVQTGAHDAANPDELRAGPDEIDQLRSAEAVCPRPAKRGEGKGEGSVFTAGPLTRRAFGSSASPPSGARRRSAAAQAAPEGPAPARPYPPPPAAPAGSREIRVAVVDISFDRLEALPSPAEGPFPVGLPDGGDASAPPPASATASWGPGHGVAMAGVVLSQCPGAHVGLFQIPAIDGAARPYLAAADLAAAVAAAVGDWQADVVLIAMSDAAWGTPSYLRDVLREAARCGRRGRGTAIFCSVGDPSRNHPRNDDSVALGADDLASQPWVHAIAACDSCGGWYRVYPGYDCPGHAPANANGTPGATYNRLGPAVAFAAPGEPTRWSEHIAADDSSQASALAAAAAARVLAENRDLTVAELRALLALTADVPAIIDGGYGLAAGDFDVRDRLGHNFKTGHGPVNVRAACIAAADPFCLALLATRTVPDPAGESRAFALARAWRDEVGQGTAPARAYARVCGRLSRLFLTSLPFQEALCWLARHVRALAEDARLAPWQAQHHGALVERIRHAIDTAQDALAVDDLRRDPGRVPNPPRRARAGRARAHPRDSAALPLQALEAALGRPGAGAAVATVLARVLGPAVMAADGRQGAPRAIALASDAVGDHPRRRGPRRADGGGEPERVPFSGAGVPGPVH